MKLDLVAGLWVRQLQGCEFGRADLDNRLPWNSMFAETMPSQPPLVFETAAHRIVSSGELWMPLTISRTGKSPEPRLDNRVVLNGECRCARPGGGGRVRAQERCATTHLP